jgi:hypothetical protein
MRIFGQAEDADPGPGVPTVITWVVTVFMLAWLVRCAAFELNSATVAGEIVAHDVIKKQRRGTRWTEDKVTVRYFDENNAVHEIRTDIYGGVPPNGRVAIRYARHMPRDGRLEGFWPVWGAWSMTAGVLVLFALLLKAGLSLRGLDWDGRPKR